MNLNTNNTSKTNLGLIEPVDKEDRPKQKVNPKKFRSVHPGLELAAELQTRRLSVAEAARLLNIKRERLSALTNCRCGVSPEMSYRIGLLFGYSPFYWSTLQITYEVAGFINTQGKEIAKGIKPYK